MDDRLGSNDESQETSHDIIDLDWSVIGKRPVTNTEAKHRLPSPTSTTRILAKDARHDRSRKGEQAQQSQEPTDRVPAMRRQEEEGHNLITLTPTNLNKVARGEKRRHSSLPNTNEPCTWKTPRLSPVIHEAATLQDYDLIRYWAENSYWPRAYLQKRGFNGCGDFNFQKTEDRVYPSFRPPRPTRRKWGVHEVFEPDAEVEQRPLP